MEKSNAETIQSLILNKIDFKAESYECEEEIVNVSVENDVAVVNIHGVIAHRGDFLFCLFGGCPLEYIKKELEFLAENSSISTIILDIDSPGGSVYGVLEFAEFVFSLRAKKTIYSLANSSACSAGYWIGAPAHRFYSSDAISIIGSIGVYYSHWDVSKALDEAGVKPTEISSTPEKVLLSENSPLSEEGKDFIQAQVDYIYGQFIDSVAKYRGLEKSFVKEKMATGLVYFGQEAIDLNFIDGILTLDNLIADVKSGKDEIFMDLLAECKTIIDFQAKFPEFYSSVVKPAMDKEKESGRMTGEALGTSRERNRFKMIEDTTIEGCEKLAYDAKYDGITTPEQFAVAQTKKIKAEQKKQPKINPLSPGKPVGFNPSSHEDKSEIEKKAVIASMRKGQSNKRGNK